MLSTICFTKVMQDILTTKTVIFHYFFYISIDGKEKIFLPREVSHVLALFPAILEANVYGVTCAG